MELWRTLNFSRPSGTLSSMCAEGEVVWVVTVVAAGKLKSRDTRSEVRTLEGERNWVGIS